MVVGEIKKKNVFLVHQRGEGIVVENTALESVLSQKAPQMMNVNATVITLGILIHLNHQLDA